MVMQQAVDFREESEALYELIAPLPQATLDKPTAFKNWTINDVIGHLHMWNWAADLALTDEDAFRKLMAGLMEHIGEGKPIGAFERDWRKGLSGHPLIEVWRDFYREMAARFADVDPSKRVPWVGPDMSVRSSITARLMETWAHGQAVYDMLGVVRQNTDRIRNIVILGVNTYGWTFKVRGQEPPMPPPHLRLTAPSGDVWTYNDPDEEDLIEGPAEAFCQVVTQVRNIADTSLRLVGDKARSWMENAQCFAGPPETPPAPGTRKTARPAT